MDDILLSETGHSKVYMTSIHGKKYVKKISSYRERRFLSLLQHPNIISPIEITDNYILMPLYEKNLYRNSGGIPYSHLVSLCRQLLSAVEYIHDKNIIHADIKPSNILLDGMNPILIDFTSAVTRGYNSGNPGCTEGYAAPEIMRGEFYDEKIDTWSLGVTILTIIHGDNPFDNCSVRNIESILKSQEIEETLIKFKSVGTLVRKMLVIDPSSRPSISECIKYL